ncbi:gamma-interferon-responsive lysosomal thiol protein [Mercurialis annua]|uniref:gamma-interferon-responsive lysosomal thiol protein n=1 Tax=Mercurialis annua TaxID=3986 RepID=UPI002160BA3F|nr:gamma-interferon-responsive lysosomal thiol protein [Mercurialis annua]
MASLRPFSPVFLLTITCVLLCCFVSPSSSDDTVTMSVYYETLCPYCADFIVNRLVKLFDTGLISIVKLRMIPWGNALIQSDGSFVCQHGPNECFLNAIEACAITIYPDVERHFRFIQCMERLAIENQLNQWVNCYQIAGLAKEPAIDCYTNGHGNMIEQQFGGETTGLSPPHRFVPWIVVNNQPLQEDFENFVSYVCKAYTGTQLPEACQSLPAATNSLLTENPISSVCFSDKTPNFTISSSTIKSFTSTHH